MDLDTEKMQCSHWKGRACQLVTGCDSHRNTEVSGWKARPGPAEQIGLELIVFTPVGAVDVHSAKGR